MIKNSKLSNYKIKKIIHCFCVDIPASKTALLLGFNRNTINRWYGIFRLAIWRYQTALKDEFIGKIEVDESYFGAKRQRGFAGKLKRGRGTLKQPVFGVFERNGRVYTEIVPDCKKKTLQAVILGKVSIDSVIYSDGWRGYNGLVDVGYSRHFRVNHSNNEFAHGHCHINGIEAFWSFTKRRLAKFNGVTKNFDLHLKECEWRWKRGVDELTKELWQLIYKD
ncbi:IS1595 family transposase [Pasteurella skyensis]|uniref:IS1595 family transposase n=3 Tax=Phocoenobacter skyensis TaxID=97481 RepID=A0AAJ6NFL4_9PAST|nr:IS1595 family transposase [Pasteurella skyensis]MDP8169710.1 IS1595 family transposase [Pasteurella skyensis]MDP8175921.1 IS1595 family transposase [Pasteurella skyensis]